MLTALIVETETRLVEASHVQIVIGTGQSAKSAQTFGVRVMLLTDRPDGQTARRLAGCGSLIDIETTLESALSGLLDDPMGYDLFVMDCDGFGGISGGEHAIAALIAAEARMRVMLVSGEFDVPAYPLGLRTAVCLPTEVQDEGFRRGFHHVLRDRAAVTMM